MKTMTNTIALALAAGLATTASAQLVVDLDLGVIGAGTHNVSATTGNDNANNYPPFTNPAVFWTGEYVVQFTTTSTFSFGGAFNFESDDTDSFLLDGLGVTAGAADNAIAFAFLDFGPESYGVFPAGTYYMSLETFGGAGSSPLTSTFDYDLTLTSVGPWMPGPAAANPPAAMDLGVIANEGDIFTIDTFLSDFDTELGLYDQAGVLLANNDDAVGLQSEVSTDLGGGISGLGAGTYYFAVGEFNTTFADDFLVTPGDAGGTIGGQANGVSFSGTLAPGEVKWYSFRVVPAPASVALLGLGGLAAARRRRA